MNRSSPAGSLRALSLVAACVLAGSATAEETTAGAVHRFALFVGNNEGGDGTKALLYSRDDATRLRDVFTRLGGVRSEDSMLLLDDSADAVLTALGELERRSRDARARGERTALLFYYSGHAKDGALRLGQSRLPLESVKLRLSQGPSDIRVAVFDACRSGTATRTKGVRRAPSFEVESDATRAAKGVVILTSSASDEDSQESDLIGASYFSYHLATGLIGSADKSGDGRVSLAEAYAYAYERTVASTADSAAGAQHPTFSFELAGNGDLMLTDVVQRREGLHLPQSAPAGPYFVIDRRGVVVAEVIKGDLERTIALGPGSYTIKRRLADRLRIGSVSVGEGQLVSLDEAAFRDAPFADDPVKGTGISSIYSRHWSLSASGHYQAVFDAPAPVGSVPSAPLLGGEATSHNFFGRGYGLGFDALYGWTSGLATTRAQLGVPFRYTVLSLGACFVAEWFQHRRWVPFVGVRVALDRSSREFPGGEAVAQSFTTLSPGVFGGVKFRVGRSVSLVGRARVHYLFFNSDPAETRSFGYTELGLLLDYEFWE